MRTSNTFIIVAFLSLVVVCFETTAQSESDPVLAALKAYEKAVDDFRQLENPSSDARVALRREWQKRFQVVVDQNPQSAYIEAARTELLGLFNGLGEFDKSQEILHEIVSQVGNTEEKIRWYNELGEVCRMEFLAKNDQSEAQKSLDAFEQAHTLYLSLPSGVRRGDMGGRQVVALCMAGNLSGMLDNHKKSATLYQSARELFQASTENAVYAVMVHYDLEHIVEQEMLAWVRAKEESKALNCLEMFSKLPSYRWPPSHYALMYSELWYENNSKGFQDFVSKWLNKNAHDERTPILRARLAFSYYDDGLFEQALPIYEVLRDKHRGDFQKLEPDAFRQGRGGHYDRILSDLAIIYLRQGNFDGAEKVKNELTELLPQSSDIERLTPEHWSVDMAQLPQPQRNMRHMLIRGIFMVAGVVLILSGLYLRYSGRK